MLKFLGYLIRPSSKLYSFILMEN